MLFRQKHNKAKHFFGGFDWQLVQLSDNRLLDFDNIHSVSESKFHPIPKE
uniref:Uncharacterized protein n=1 Tax=Candidatus Kentrum sp. FW TaxID=2126338 RepID=A0A450S619_9GAMM|nr:MAG: hypothetical protein BECKFW1821B_GA0114236_100238 [Candidatus Kentron sp. FW]VFJ65209.1 MAG: hypothetical protein BECKFW1821C_GA0114237_100724 [Candidatus Kentron sp. FW]